MKGGSYSGVTRPGFLLVKPELPVSVQRKAPLGSVSEVNYCFQSYPLMRKTGLITRLQSYSVADRALSSRSNVSGRDRYNSRSDRERGARSSPLGSRRTSLSDNKEERKVNRAKVYEFLRGIGVVPDELDGLELPVTVDVMRERVDFLRKLGLTIEDINCYPLILGCSVKKNMIPVLDYLGKLGVRKSTFTEFLRRYPQVLHASVVVDLDPVVKYLQGMDIKPSNIPRVLERYPEVMGFKLEGTMSTSVAYLIGVGVSRRELGATLTKYPEILGMRVGRVIKPFVEYLVSLGLPKLAVARLIEKQPYILGFGLEDKVKPNVDLLLEFDVRREVLASVVAQYPEIIGLDLAEKLPSQRALLSSVIDLGLDNFGGLIEKMPQTVSLSRDTVVKHVNFLKDCGFTLQQVRTMVEGCPQVLALNLDLMKLSFDYFQAEMCRPLDDLVAFPAYFTYNLESTVKPRQRRIAENGLKCSLSWFLNCSNEKFEDRMTYDTIDMEEMEMPSFDMNSLMEPRSDDSDSDYDDSDDDE